MLRSSLLCGIPFKPMARKLYPSDITPLGLKRRLSVTGHIAKLSSILYDVSNREGIDMPLLLSRTRKRPVVEARQIYFKRAKEITKCTLTDIGSIVGRDHATVSYGINHVEETRDLMEKYNRYFGVRPAISEWEDRMVKMISPFADHPAKESHYAGYKKSARLLEAV